MKCPLQKLENFHFQVKLVRITWWCRLQQKSIILPFANKCPLWVKNRYFEPKIWTEVVALFWGRMTRKIELLWHRSTKNRVLILINCLILDFDRCQKTDIPTSELQVMLGSNFKVKFYSESNIVHDVMLDNWKLLSNERKLIYIYWSWSTKTKFLSSSPKCRSMMWNGL